MSRKAKDAEKCAEGVRGMENGRVFTGNGAKNGGCLLRMKHLGFFAHEILDSGLVA